MSKPLEGRTIALAEGRQLEELAQMLEKEGATALRCPTCPRALTNWKCRPRVSNPTCKKASR